jgi:putative transcriptional regulator
MAARQVDAPAMAMDAAKNSLSTLAGRMLVAMPGIGDERFERSVIYLCAHDREHAMGLTVNRPAGDLTVPDLLERLGILSTITVPKDLVLLGGPVERERGFVLHTDDYTCAGGTLRVTKGVSLTPTREVLEAMAGKASPPRRAILALGYAGWGPGQLERELKDNTWLICEPDEALIFGDDYPFKWTKALARIGVDAAALSPTSGRA